MSVFSWIIETTSVAPAGAKGHGLFATSAIQRGQIVAAFGGIAVDSAQFQALPNERQIHALQISDELFLVGPEESEPADYFNHSCDPNLGFMGNVILVALRDIETGEEMTFDYAMCDSDPYDEFSCLCGSANCRNVVTGDDWKLADVQIRYSEYFSSYLTQRIKSEFNGLDR